MKFSEVKTELYTHSGKLSDLIRQLALAGFAVIWVFKVGTTVSFVPAYLMPSAALFLLALVADLGHYSVLTWGYRKQADAGNTEARNKVALGEAADVEGVDISVPSSINKRAEKFYLTKFVSVVAGYVWLLGVLIWLLSAGRIGAAADATQPSASAEESQIDTTHLVPSASRRSPRGQ